jgi:hypothetical protein
MSFRTAVESTPNLADKYQAGLQALEPADRERIVTSRTRRLCGSLNLDGALQAFRPNEARWDYGVCYAANDESVLWIEVHPSRGIRQVESKFVWLRQWLSGEGRRLGALPRRYVWISSGEMTFTQRSPEIRRLAALGLESRARVLRLD